MRLVATTVKIKTISKTRRRSQRILCWKQSKNNLFPGHAHSICYDPKYRFCLDRPVPAKSRLPMQELNSAYKTCKFGLFHIKLLFITFVGFIAGIYNLIINFHAVLDLRTNSYNFSVYVLLHKLNDTVQFTTQRS